MVKSNWQIEIQFEREVLPLLTQMKDSEERTITFFTEVNNSLMIRFVSLPP